MDIPSPAVAWAYVLTILTVASVVVVAAVRVWVPKRFHPALKMKKVEVVVVIVIILILGSISDRNFNRWLFAPIGTFALLIFLGWLYWERKRRLPPRLRHLLMLAVYIFLPLNLYLAHRYVWPGWDTRMIEHNVRERLGQTYGTIHSLSLALEAYYNDNASYPPAVDANGKIVPLGSGGKSVSSGDFPWLVTTPVAYMTSLPADSFTNPPLLLPYRYATNGKNFYIISSIGPDSDVDLNIGDFLDREANADSPFELISRVKGSAVEYDPTNGIGSSGDIIRAGTAGG